VGYFNNPNNFLVSVAANGGRQSLIGWGENRDNGYPTPYVTDAYGNGMMAKNMDRHFYNNTNYRVFMPNKTGQEQNAAFRYAAGNTGMAAVDGYVWNPSNTDPATYGNRYSGPAGSSFYFWANTAAYPTDSGFCWNGSPGYISWGTPPACPTGFTDDGVQQAVVVSYLDWGTGANAGGGELTPTNLVSRHSSISWQFYQYFTWGCGVPGYPYFGASVRYCKYLAGTN
jgi:hypothetical protein